MKESNATTGSGVSLKLSRPSFLLAFLAFVTWNGTFLFILLFNLSLIFGSFIFPFISNFYCDARVFACLFYAGVIILLPSGGWKCHLGDGKPWRKFSEKFYYPGSIMRSYLKLNFGALPTVFVEAEAKQDAQFIIAAFPHGCGSEFRILMEGCIQQVMPNIVKKNNLRTLAASILFQIPLVREVALWTGCIDANRKTASKALDRGRSLLILPGGESEQILTEYGKERVFLQTRKGFIKLAMTKNVAVVPMYVFGSSDLFYTSHFLLGPRKWIQKKFGICIPFCFGLFGSMCPLPKATTIVLGSPLRFEMKGSDPTADELNDAHQTFCNELKQLFDSNKSRLGYGDRDLEIL